MGRIDKALCRRVAGGAVGAATAARQRQFVSAWASDQDSDAVARNGVGAVAVPASVEEPASMLLESTAALPVPHFGCGERLVSDSRCDPALVEQFRRLAAKLHGVQASDGIRVVMITSASPGDGKTMTALNLALTLSGSYKRRVLLIDGDLRRPSLSEMAGLGGHDGLSGVLKAKVDQKLMLTHLVEGLTLLPAGDPDPDPMSGLTSSRMRRILVEAATHFDWVLLDSSPMGTLADAGLLGRMVDGVLLVVRAGRTQHSLVQKAVDSFGREHFLGVVLNGATGMEEPVGYRFAGYA